MDLTFLMKKKIKILGINSLSILGLNNIFKDKTKIMSTELKPKVIFILGGPGAGKGTQCGIMTEKYGF